MKTLTLILSLFFCIYLFGQTNPHPAPSSYSKKELPNNLKKVFYYEDEQLVQIKGYNNNRKIIFLFDAQTWMKPMDLVYISGKLYDESGNLVEIFNKNNLVYNYYNWKAAGAQYEFYYTYESLFISFHLTRLNQKEFNHLSISS